MKAINGSNLLTLRHVFKVIHVHKVYIVKDKSNVNFAACFFSKLAKISNIRTVCH